MAIADPSATVATNDALTTKGFAAICSALRIGGGLTTPCRPVFSRSWKAEIRSYYYTILAEGSQLLLLVFVGPRDLSSERTRGVYYKNHLEEWYHSMLQQ